MGQVSIKMKNDFSKINIGTKGVFKGISFKVVGRINFGYIYGGWNEWYISFSNGSFGWISETLGKYTVTMEYAPENEEFFLQNYNISYQQPNVDFNNLKINETCFISLIDFFTQRISTSPIEKIEGTIPFLHNNYLKNIVLVKEQKIMKIMFDRNDKVQKLYFGEKIFEDELNLFNFQTLDDIFKQTKEKKGKIAGFYCPVCSAPNPKITGVTNISFCRTCNTKLDISSIEIEVLEDGYKNSEHDTTLQCGSIANINDRKYIVVGVLLKEFKTTYGLQQFTEYFLYQEGGYQLFFWLIEDRKSKKWYYLRRVKASLLKYEFNNKPNMIGKVLMAWGGFDFDVSTETQFEIYEAKHKSLIIRKQVNKTSTPYFHQEVFISTLEEVPTRDIMKYFKISHGHLVTQEKLNIN